jgi:hypothetical protein
MGEQETRAHRARSKQHRQQKECCAAGAKRARCNHKSTKKYVVYLYLLVTDG